MSDPRTVLLREHHAPAHVLVTGASRGIGLALVRALLTNPQVAQLTAVARHATRSEALGDLALADARLQCLDVDVTDETALAALAGRLRAHHPSLQLVIHAAGMLHGDGIGPEKSVTQVRRATLEQVFALNAFAPILLARALLPLLEGPCVFASLSARVGSIGDNRLGGWYAYRASKAAQNQLMKTFAIELARRNRRGCCLLLHPGTVDTGLSAPFQANVPAARLFAPERAAAQLLHIIAQATPQDSGRFIAWDGTDIPW
ncbi:SDR family NAD(P)-dependent oxidoreductase [Dyella sp.]|jgi:NAD(P)-dependent dehydrogenase (short-subunit alcohol dehydrogenase family)|uniref:SDR family NAD(P)-dependent oxidoreductase n=1 Tax=Dyella sp. TaxID=1869338 RepID=UPI002D765011|nr:SDR family NAD(P)-dependent oxidoreductase [Dyella sp.]HET6431323.1 SDR family NAD(P)-dependent oxidoreductase [Dyella sp.]